MDNDQRQRRRRNPPEDRATPDDLIDAYARRSQLVVAGLPEKLGATNMALDPTPPNAGLFRIDEILHGPRELSGFAGNEITVLFNDAGSVRAGEPSVLFATSWQYGPTLAVIEIGQVEDRERATMRKRVGEAYDRLDDERLLQRIALAELVIAGKVVRTAPAGEEIRRRMPVTEHAPDWWEAVIEVESVEKGRHQGKTVTIFFPNSVDVAWSQCPKFKVGQDGVWILQRDQQERGWPIMRIRGLTALDPLDFQSRSRADHIRRLIRRR